MRPGNIQEELEFLISRGLDGDASAEERAALDRRTAADAELGRFRDDLGSVERLLREWGRREPDVDRSAFRAAVAVRVEVASRRRRVIRLRRRVLTWAPVAAAAMIAIVVGVRLRVEGPAVVVVPGASTGAAAPTPRVAVSYSHPAPASPESESAITVRYARVAPPDEPAGIDDTEQRIAAVMVFAEAPVPATDAYLPSPL